MENENQCYVCGAQEEGYCESCGRDICKGCNSMEQAGYCQDCSDEKEYDSYE